MFSENRFSYIYLFNSPFLHDPNRDRKIKASFTRADLAYFIHQVSTINAQELPPLSFKDITPDFWANNAINFSVVNELMTEYPDNTFQPEKVVTKLEYIIALVKALELNLENNDVQLPYTDINDNHWTIKYIRAAFKT